jgi:hypothetical protein
MAGTDPIGHPIRSVLEAAGVEFIDANALY